MHGGKLKKIILSVRYDGTERVNKEWNILQDIDSAGVLEECMCPHGFVPF